MTHNNDDDYEWPNLLRAYFGVGLSRQDIEIWHTEIIRKLGGMTDGELCKAIREWGWSAEKAKRKLTLHDFIGHLRSRLGGRTGRTTSVAMQNKFNYFCKQIDKTKDNDEIWNLICTFCHQHDNIQSSLTEKLEAYARRNRKFVRPPIGPIIRKIIEAAMPEDEAEISKARHMLKQKMKERQEKEPF